MEITTYFIGLVAIVLFLRLLWLRSRADELGLVKRLVGILLTIVAIALSILCFGSRDRWGNLIDYEPPDEPWTYRH